jgi:hypothetical protein
MEDKQSSKTYELKGKDSIGSEDGNNEDKIELDEKIILDMQKQIVLLENQIKI